MSSAYYPLSLSEKHLLQAALMEENGATAAWQRWRDQVDIEQIETSSYHVLSALYVNLAHHQISDPHMSRLKGIYRRTWYANQLRMKPLRNLLAALRSADVEVLLRRDLALVASCYSDAGARLIERFDLQVSLDDVRLAFEVLKQQGWQTDALPPQKGDRLWQPIRFRDPDYFSLFLHNSLFWSSPQFYTDRLLWENAIACQLSNIPVRSLSPVDQLLALSVIVNHDYTKQRRSPDPYPIVVLADAAVMVNVIVDSATATDDWIRLLSQAQRYEMILPLRYLLVELQQLFELDIPDWVLPNLRRMAISYHELLTYALLPKERALRAKAALVKMRQRWKDISR
ncbi:nucleotidyltransferase family protein [cf. Phormidesmis sp. LEGE 11477]|uniref:nucleotidyltransferase family protein n=1 Tax=cf. Phormidesmis sp. LEGE 11477 TaxID=1828680 RepID=UPI00187F5A10|nr:nucleotidyltransferase family protein [cf. Phormidesmis sp. LEGE 11477]MBE9060366.1 nucleotidyltransferase family protein [cf. Phormidesmis sp. LEGE 11477]